MNICRGAIAVRSQVTEYGAVSSPCLALPGSLSLSDLLPYSQQIHHSNLGFPVGSPLGMLQGLCMSFVPRYAMLRGKFSTSDATASCTLNTLISRCCVFHTPSCLAKPRAAREAHNVFKITRVAHDLQHNFEPQFLTHHCCSRVPAQLRITTFERYLMPRC